MDELNAFGELGSLKKIESVSYNKISPLKIGILSGFFRLRTALNIGTRGRELINFIRKNCCTSSSEGFRESKQGPNRKNSLNSLTISRVGNSPLIFGPWTGELGMEILYWAPWVYEHALSSDIAISRGGTQFLYPSVAQYCEIFDYLSIEQWVSYQESQIKTYGGQKQRLWLNSEHDLIQKMDQNGEFVSRFNVIHPKEFFKFAYPNAHDDVRILTNYVKAMQFSLPEAMIALSKKNLLDKSLASVPRGQRVAFGLYTRDGVSSTEMSIFLKHPIVVEAMKGQKIYSVQSIYRDVHHDLKDDLTGMLFPLRKSLLASNLADQASLIFNCSKLITTHGGLAYLGLLLGKDVLALEGRGFFWHPRHKANAEFIAKILNVEFQIIKV